jgi:hypothetical protein
MKDKSRNRTRQYRERIKEKIELRADKVAEERIIRELNLAGYSETAFDVPAETYRAEIQIHRCWLRALAAPDLLPGESLRQLAKRTWDTLLASNNHSVITDGGGKWIDTENGRKWIQGHDVWYPLFSLNTYRFDRYTSKYKQGPFGEVVEHGASADWFESCWEPPSDCTEHQADEAIDPAQLPALPPMRNQ